jgi:hypothetical protein
LRCVSAVRVGALYNAVADLDDLVVVVNARTLQALEVICGKPAPSATHRLRQITSSPGSPI